MSFLSIRSLELFSNYITILYSIFIITTICIISLFHDVYKFRFFSAEIVIMATT